ncbi:VOC family protein [Bacillus sp. NPDC077027]|uniref:VOC family protein n=1 Tax=Bacillus sp. NPDC077027 TaxID=3390548 RepID=UPI003D07AE33
MIKGLYEAHLPVKDLKTSVAFYEKLELELAYQNERVAFFWLEKGLSWLALWETNVAETPYHPSIRHVAFRIEKQSVNDVKNWLLEKGIQIHTQFGYTADQQPLVLDNPPQAHAAIYFTDPDGNLLECMAPLELDTAHDIQMMTFADWEQKHSPFNNGISK